MLRFLLHVFAFSALTAVTQLGGIAWLVSLMFHKRLLAFAVTYATLTILAWNIAPFVGRVPISCGSDGSLRMQSWFYCLTNRNYVVPELVDAAQDLANDMQERFPGTLTLALDGSFPFVTGFPLLPHLSHKDGRKLDLAYYYADQGGNYLPGETRSPIGYFAFETGRTQCPDKRFSLRWDMDWLQPLFAKYPPERKRMVAMLNWLARTPGSAACLSSPICWSD